jgi:hypothetical protein
LHCVIEIGRSHGNLRLGYRIDLTSSFREDATMRWKIRPSGHDPRQIDLVAVLAILVVIIAVDHYLTESAKSHVTSAFIEPSQTVRW